MPDQEQIEIVIDETKATAAIGRANAAIEGYEKRSVSAFDKSSQAFGAHGETVIRISDRSRSSLERQIQSFERLSKSYGQSELERFTATRDRLIGTLGNERGAVERISGAYDTLIQKMEAAERKKFGQEFGRGVKEFVEAPLQSAGNAVSSLLGALGPMGAAVAGGGVALAAIAASGFEAAKSLGEFGNRIHDGELRTGLSTAEVQKFSFAAQAVGADVSSVERLMRGLTIAIEDDSVKAQHARDTLRGFGVDIAAVRSGSASTAETLLKISEGLERMDNPLQRNKTALDLFKRAGIESIPVLLELRENFRYFDEHHLTVANEQDVNTWRSLTKEVAALNNETGALKRLLLSPVAALWTVTVKVAGTGAERFLGMMGAGTSRVPPMSEQIRRDNEDEARMGQQRIIDQNAPEVKAALERWGRSKDGLELAIQVAKKNEQDALEKLKSGDISGIAELRNAQLKGRTSSDALKELNKLESARVSVLEKEHELRRQGSGFYQIGTGIGKDTMVLVTEQQIEEANRVRNIPTLFGGGVPNPFSAQLGSDPLLRAGVDFATGEFVSPSSQRGYGTGEQEILRARQAGFNQEAHQELTLRLANIKAEEKETIRLLELRTRPGGELETAQRVAAIRQDAITRELAITGDITKAREASLQNEMEERLKIAEIDKRQHDEIAHVAQGLATTLFTNPRNFPRQFRDTITSAALKPFTEGIGDVTANVLQPFVFGKNSASPMRITADHPLPVYVINGGGSPSGFSFPSSGNAYTDSGGPSLYPPASIPAGSGGFTGGVPLSALTGLLPLLSGSAQAFPAGVNPAASIGPGGTSGFAGPVSFGGGTVGPRSGFGGLPAIFQNGTTTLANLGGIFGVGTANKIPGPNLNGPPGLGSYGTSLTSVATSPAAGVAGGLLTNQAFFGSNQGTIGGIFEGTAGGALIGAGIGMQFGGPFGAAIGAGIGAAAGFGIGLGELIAGVEPQWREAERLVRSKYGISIPHSEADKVVAIANSSFGGRVSVAVESPQVRQMLGLYAAGTGQRFPASADQPHAASLLEQGGKLYQQQTFQYGVGSVYNSTLPVAGGYAPQILPNPTYASLTLLVNGQSAADMLEGRVANVANPAYIQTQYSASLANSDGRVSNIATLSDPGLITG